MSTTPPPAQFNIVTVTVSLTYRYITLNKLIKFLAPLSTLGNVSGNSSLLPEYKVLRALVVIGYHTTPEVAASTCNICPNKMDEIPRHYSLHIQ